MKAQSQRLATGVALASLLMAGSSALAAPIQNNSSASRLQSGPQRGEDKGPGVDCNNNGIPDDVDIQSGNSQDCNNDGIPDECPVCPPVDVVFVMDTSGSMNDEGNVLCNSINGVVADLLSQGIQVNATFLGITQTSYPCLQDTVLSLLGGAVPGNPPCCPTLAGSEDWGPATAIVAERFAWLPGAVRVIVPISDEGARSGNPCTGSDDAAIDNAIIIANANNVICSPISGTGSAQCVIDQASNLAVGTGGTSFLSTQPNLDLAGAIALLLTDACLTVADCNHNGVPDECDPDSNGNDVPDDCEDGNELDCAEFDRFEDLTPNDTLTLVTQIHNPGLEQGFLQVVAVDEMNNPIGFDYLIGNSLVIDGFDVLDYSINPVDYRAAVPHGIATDADGDGILDLNGIEYEQTAGRILIPHFFGQNSQTAAELLLISLAGGRKFDTTVDFLVTNDNEVTFSAEHTFRCWDKVSLQSISTLFSNDFLQNYSGDDDQESIGGLESGWMQLDGGVANSSAASIDDPAFYAVYLEHINGYTAADLPFETCLQSGHLLPNSVIGDNEEALGELPQDCDVEIGRRQPGSFLLYPEFDNRAGEVSIITVTNTSATESVKAHFVYVGRFGN